MRIPRIYVEQALCPGARIELPPGASHYLKHVLRRRAGEAVRLFDGRGGSYSARVAAGGRRTSVEVIEFEADDRESPLRITLAQGISRGRHMDTTVQKAVELGVAGIVPVASEFSNVRLDEDRARKRAVHWRGIAIAACEQCGRNRIPEVAGPVAFGDWIREAPGALRLILDPGAPRGLRSIAAEPPELILLAGPEGGFSEREVEAAVAAGYSTVRIGPRVLRTETTALAAIAACQSLWGDLG